MKDLLDFYEPKHFVVSERKKSSIRIGVSPTVAIVFRTGTKGINLEPRNLEVAHKVGPDCHKPIPKEIELIARLQATKEIAKWRKRSVRR